MKKKKSIYGSMVVMAVPKLIKCKEPGKVQTRAPYTLLMGVTLRDQMRDKNSYNRGRACGAMIAALRDWAKADKASLVDTSARYNFITGMETELGETLVSSILNSEVIDKPDR